MSGQKFPSAPLIQIRTPTLQSRLFTSVRAGAYAAISGRQSTASHSMDSGLPVSPTNSRSSATPLDITPHLVPPASRKRSISATPADPRHSQGLKRKVTRACDICKSKKAKCSGTQPCESCARRGLVCLYESRYSRGKPPTPPQGDQSRSSQPIDDRSAQVAFVSINHGRPQTADMNPSASASHAPTQESRQSIFDAADKEKPRPSHAAHDVPSRGSPELDVAGQYSDSTSGLSFLHRAWRRLSNNQNSQLTNGTLASSDENQRLGSAGDKPFEDSGNLRVPPLARARELLAMYFDVCIATYRMLHRPTVSSWLDTVVHNSEAHNAKPLWYGISRAKASIVLTILAIATFHEEKAKGNSAEASQFSSVNSQPSLGQCDALFCEALSLSETETGFPKLESAQSRLVQVLYLLMSSRMNQAWYTFGHTLQIISALGLHRRENPRRRSQRLDYIDEQCRKRTFWVAYTLDKYLGVIFGRPRHYHDDDIDQDFPESINDEDMSPNGPLAIGTDDCHIESLVFHAKLAQIAERISREVYAIKNIPDHERIAASHRLGAELRRWKASLPPFLGAINPSSLITSFRRQATALKLAYCHAVMLAHRPFLLKNVTRDRQEIRELARESINECITAAQSVLESVDRMAREGRLFHAFWWTHYVCFCALVVIYVWAIQQSNNTPESGDHSYARIFEQAERCLAHLAQATATNSPSRRYSIILQELRAEAKRKTARRPPDAASSVTVHDGQGGEFVHLSPASGSNAVPAQWQPMFGSPIDTATSGLPDFLDNWQTTDWLDLDSSAFGPFPTFDTESLGWIGGMS